MNFEFLKHLSIPFSKVLYDGLVGAYQSRAKGNGTDYDSSRPYDSNDHPKYIDWKTTAKKNSLYTKQYHNDQELHVCLIIDVGQSMQFGFKGNTKYDMMCNVAVLLASIVTQHNDSFSYICYDQQIEEVHIYMHQSSVIPQLLKSLSRLSSLVSSQSLYSNLPALLSRLSSLITRPTHFIFITDDQDEMDIPLLHGLSKQHEISYICIQHSLEQSGISGALVSDGKTAAHTLPHDYKKIKENKNLERSRAIKNFGGFYCSLNESSDLQKSLLSLWR